jgi:hypothetical protein
VLLCDLQLEKKRCTRKNEPHDSIVGNRVLHSVPVLWMLDGHLARLREDVKLGGPRLSTPATTHKKCRING